MEIFNSHRNNESKWTIIALFFLVLLALGESKHLRMTQDVSDTGISTAFNVSLDQTSHTGKEEIEVILEQEDKKGPLWLSAIPKDESFEISLLIVPNDNDIAPAYSCNGTAFIFCEVPVDWLNTLKEDSNGKSDFFVWVWCQSSIDTDTCPVKLTLLTGTSKELRPTAIEHGLTTDSQIKVSLTQHYPSFVNIFVPNDQSIDRVNVISYMSSAFEAYEMVGFSNGPGDLNNPDWISGPMKNFRFLPISSNDRSFQWNHNYTIGLYPFETIEVMLLAFTYQKLTHMNHTFYDSLPQKGVNYYKVEVCGSNEACDESQSLVISVFPFSGSPNLYVSYGDQPSSLEDYLFQAQSPLNNALHIKASDREKARVSSSSGEFYYVAVESSAQINSVTTYMVEWTSSDVVFLVEGVKIGGTVEGNDIEQYLFKKSDLYTSYSIKAHATTGHIQVFLKECDGESENSADSCKIYDHEVENPNEYSDGSVYFISSQYGTFHYLEIPLECQVYQSCFYSVGVWANETTNFTIEASPENKPQVLVESQVNMEEISQNQLVSFSFEAPSAKKNQRLTILIITFFGDNRVSISRLHSGLHADAPEIVFKDQGNSRMTQLRNITLGDDFGGQYLVEVFAITHCQVGVEFLLEDSDEPIEKEVTMIEESLLFPGLLNSSHPTAYYSIPYSISSSEEPLTIYINRISGYSNLKYSNESLPTPSSEASGNDYYSDFYSDEFVWFDMKKIYLSQDDYPAKGTLYLLVEIVPIEPLRRLRELEGLGDESAQKRRSQEINGEEYDQKAQYSLSYSIGTLRMQIEESVPFIGYTDSNEVQYFYLPIVSQTSGIEVSIDSYVILDCRLNIGQKVELPGQDPNAFLLNFSKTAAIEPYQVLGACFKGFNDCWLTLEVRNTEEVDKAFFELVVFTKNLVVIEEDQPLELPIPKAFYSSVYLLFAVNDPNAPVTLSLSSGVAQELILAASIYDHANVSISEYPEKGNHDFAVYNESEVVLEIPSEEMKECSKKECFVIFAVVNYGDRTPEEDAFRVVVSNSNKETALMIGMPFKGKVTKGETTYFETQNTKANCDLEFILTPMDGGDASIYVNRGRESFPNVEKGKWDYGSANQGADFILITQDKEQFSNGVEFFTIAVYGDQNGDVVDNGEATVSFYISVTCQGEKTINILTPGEGLPVVIEEGKPAHFAYLNTEENTPYILFHWDFGLTPIQSYFLVLHPSISTNTKTDWRDALIPLLPDENNYDLEAYSRDSSSMSGNWVYVYKEGASDRDMDEGSVYLFTLISNQTSVGRIWAKNPEHPLVLSPGYPFVDYLFSEESSLYVYVPEEVPMDGQKYFLEISLVYNNSAEILVYLSSMKNVSTKNFELFFSSNETRNEENPSLFTFEFSVDWSSIYILVVPNTNVPVTVTMGSTSSSMLYIYSERVYDAMLISGETRKYKVTLENQHDWEVDVDTLMQKGNGVKPDVKVYRIGPNGKSTLVSERDNEKIQISEAETYLIGSPGALNRNGSTEYEIVFSNNQPNEGSFFHFSVQMRKEEDPKDGDDIEFIEIGYNEAIEDSLAHGEKEYLSVYTGEGGFIVVTVSHCIGNFKVVLADSVEDIQKGKTTLKNYKTFSSYYFNTVWLVEITPGQSIFISIEATQVKTVPELGVTGAIYQFKANYFKEDIYEALMDFQVSGNSLKPFEEVRKSKGQLEVTFDQVDLSEEFWYALDSQDLFTPRLQYKIIAAKTYLLLQLSAGCPEIAEDLISRSNSSGLYSYYLVETNLNIRKEDLTSPTFFMSLQIDQVKEGYFTVVGSLSLSNFLYPYFYQTQEIPSGKLIPNWVIVLLIDSFLVIIGLLIIIYVLRREYKKVKKRLDLELSDVMRQAAPSGESLESQPRTRSAYSNLIDDKPN